MSIFSNPAASSAEDAREYVGALLGLLGDERPLDVLRGMEGALHERVDGLARATLVRPEAPGKWSVAQVLQHLADSDLVWGWRVRMVLSHDRPAITGYDQDKWAERLRYEDADAQQALNDFGVLRAANLRLIERAAPEELKRVGVHNERGEESIEHMMKLYAAHDLLHLRQIERILRAVDASPAVAS